MANRFLFLAAFLLLSCRFGHAREVSRGVGRSTKAGARARDSVARRAQLLPGADDFGAKKSADEGMVPLLPTRLVRFFEVDVVVDEDAGDAVVALFGEATIIEDSLVTAYQGLVEALPDGNPLDVTMVANKVLSIVEIDDGMLRRRGLQDGINNTVTRRRVSATVSLQSTGRCYGCPPSQRYTSGARRRRARLLKGSSPPPRNAGTMLRRRSLQDDQLPTIGQLLVAYQNELLPASAVILKVTGLREFDEEPTTSPTDAPTMPPTDAPSMAPAQSPSSKSKKKSKSKRRR